jgi:hypothetical protein
MREACVLGKGFVTGCDTRGKQESGEQRLGQHGSCLGHR